MAVFSAIALLVALGLAALFSLQPWASNTVAPQLSVAPGLDVGLGDSVVVARDRRLAVAPAQPAAGAVPRLIAAGVAVEEGESQLRLGVAAARVVAGPQSGAPSQGSSPQSPPQPQPEPEAIPSPPPSTVPVAVPVATLPPPVEPAAAPPTRGAGGTPGPVTAGGGTEGDGTSEVLEVCEGDEYTLSLAPVEDTEGEALPPVVPHDLTVYFGRSSEGVGFYLVLFDSQAVEIGDDPVLVEPGKSCTQVDLGLLLGESIDAGTEIHVEAIGDALEPVVP